MLRKVRGTEQANVGDGKETVLVVLGHLSDGGVWDNPDGRQEAVMVRKGVLVEEEGGRGGGGGGGRVRVVVHGTAEYGLAGEGLRPLFHQRWRRRMSVVRRWGRRGGHNHQGLAARPAAVLWGSQSLVSHERTVRG